MYDAALPEGVDYTEDSSKAVQFMKNLLNRAMSVNPSLDANLFLEALAGSHGLDRYSFSSDGSVQTVDDMLRKPFSHYRHVTSIEPIKCSSAKCGSDFNQVACSHEHRS